MTLKTSGATMALVLPFSPAAAAVARRELGLWLEQVADCDERGVDECALVVSELVGNAVRHAQPLANGTVEVSWQKRTDGLDIAVTDGGADTRPHKVDAGLSSLSGRGLAIVEAVTGRWWVESDHTRTTVHALISSR
ncbi:MAG TPA: ATP-binding protein [Marmoricola sp.]|jgi:serine/threonine-protein kinase RsbW